MIESIPLDDYDADKQHAVHVAFHDYVKEHQFDEPKNPSKFVELYKTVRNPDEVCMISYMGHHRSVLEKTIETCGSGSVSDYNDTEYIGKGIAMCYKTWQEGKDPFPGVTAETACKTFMDIVLHCDRFKLVAALAPLLSSLGMDVLRIFALSVEDAVAYTLGGSLFLKDDGQVQTLRRLNGVDNISIATNLMRKHPQAYVHLAFRHQFTAEMMICVGSVLYSLGD